MRQVAVIMLALSGLAVDAALIPVMVGQRRWLDSLQHRLQIQAPRA